VKDYNNLTELENLIKELVKIARERTEESFAFKKEVLKVKRQNEQYQTGVNRVIKMIDELIKDLEDMKG